MKEIETQYRDQSRWNQFYGKENLENFQKQSDKFLVNPSKLSSRKANLIKAVPQIKDQHILELGSGKGEFSVILAQMGATVTGIDIGDDLVALSRRVAAINKVDCTFMVGSTQQLELADETFDYVVGNDILHHLPKAGIVDSVREAYRVLKPGGRAFFTEPIENSKTFDFIQNLVPVGTPGSPQYRPSLLQRKKWRTYLAQVDDRAVSDTELAAAKGAFREVEFQYYGLLIRLERLLPNATLYRLLDGVDQVMTHKYSPFKRLSRSVLAIYKK